MLELVFVVFVMTIPVAVVGLVIMRMLTPKKKDMVFPMKDGYIIFPDKSKK